MSIATPDEEAVGSKTSRLPGRARMPFDVFGALAVGVAAAGLVSTVVFLRPDPAAVPQTVSVPPTRDQWYLDARPPAAWSVVGDRWWQDDAARDRWYLDNR